MDRWIMSILEQTTFRHFQHSRHVTKSLIGVQLGDRRFEKNPFLFFREKLFKK